MDNKTFNSLDQSLKATINARGEDYFYFGGTAYLGIPQNPEFLELYLEGIRRFGLNNGTSRGNNVQLGIYDQVEAYAAQKFRFEAALVTSSGFLAAQLAIRNLTAFGTVRYAPETHPAMWIQQNPSTQIEFDQWSRTVLNEINQSDQQNWILISNSMNNLRPERYDFSFLQHINQNKDVLLILDDSHGIGINNQGTTTSASIASNKNVEILLVASMAKALGVDAGIILGTQRTIERLKKSYEFLGASPPAAAGLFAFSQAENIYQTELSKLQLNISSLGNALKKNPNWDFIPEFPVFFSKNADLSAKMLAQRILISSFPYPDQNGGIVNRIVLSSWHKAEAIHKLITVLS